MNKGQLVVFSGPSGVGKGTVLHHCLQSREKIVFSVSATTRTPRPGEVDGTDYFFLRREDFEEMIKNNGMLEYACYNGNFYGTPKQPVDAARAEGKDVVLEIEVQGALQVKQICPDALLIFVMPPSWETLVNRLSGRKTEDAATIASRLTIAKQELQHAYAYDYVIVNDQVETAAARLGEIISAGRCSQQNMKKFIDEVNQNA